LAKAKTYLKQVAETSKLLSINKRCDGIDLVEALEIHYGKLFWIRASPVMKIATG
jgi:hypothetical protein